MWMILCILTFDLHPHAILKSSFWMANHTKRVPDLIILLSQMLKHRNAPLYKNVSPSSTGDIMGIQNLHIGQVFVDTPCWGLSNVISLMGKIWWDTTSSHQGAIYIKRQSFKLFHPLKGVANPTNTVPILCMAVWSLIEAVSFSSLKKTKTN